MRALWIVVFVIGCGSKKDQATPEPAKGSGSAVGSASGATSGSAGSAAGSAAAPSADCTARAEKIDKRLHELAASVPGFMPLIRDVNAPKAAAGKAIDARGFVVAVKRDGTYVIQGAVLATTKNATEYLDGMNKTALEKWAMDGNSTKDAHFPLYIWADRDAPGGKVAELVAAANAKSDHWSLRLLVEGKSTAPAEPMPAGASDVAKKLPTTEPDGTKYLADSLKTAIGACKPIIMAFGTYVIEGTPAKETDKLVAELPKGLVTCDCKLPSTDVFEWGMYEWFGASAPPLAWIDMPKLGKTDKKPLGKLVK